MPIDYKKYPPNWKTEIVPKVRKRSGGKCEFCGLPNKSLVYSLRIDMKDPGSGKYKDRRIWLTGPGNYERLKTFAKEVKTVTVVLTVAHLDHDRDNFKVKLNRLRDLCQYCHINYDARERFKNTKNKFKK